MTEHDLGGVEETYPDPQQVRELQEGFLDRQRPVVLIGPMAAGKSYIGMHLARFYGYRFIDADQLFVEKFGPIPDFFELYGEAQFRLAEAEIISQVLDSPIYRNSIFSLGGGAPMTESVAERLKQEKVIYILVDEQTVQPRIEGNKSRPLLQPNPMQRWSEIFQARRGQYESLAQYILDARGNRSITDMTAELQQFILETRKAVEHDS